MRAIISTWSSMRSADSRPARRPAEVRPLSGPPRSWRPPPATHSAVTATRLPTPKVPATSAHQRRGARIEVVGLLMVTSVLRPSQSLLRARWDDVEVGPASPPLLLVEDDAQLVEMLAEL